MLETHLSPTSMKTSLSFLRVNSKSTKISESDYYVVLYQGHTYELLNVYQTSTDKDSESLDSSVSFLSGRTDRQRTAFFEVRTESGKQTDTGQDFPENPDKNQTRNTEIAIRRILMVLTYKLWGSFITNESLD